MRLFFLIGLGLASCFQPLPSKVKRCNGQPMSSCNFPCQGKPRAVPELTTRSKIHSPCLIQGNGREGSKDSTQSCNQLQDRAPWVDMLPQYQPASFRAFTRFNDEHNRPLAGLKKRVMNTSSHLFASDSMPDKVLRALAAARLMNLKEIIESFEFFERVRKGTSRPAVIDACCGHGLVGLLFALLERKVERVYLVDVVFPETSERVLDILNELGPWVRPKVHYLTCSVRKVETLLKEEPDYGVVAVHACGARTDWAIEVAVTGKAPLAVMPCCYGKMKYHGSRALKSSLGAALGIDIKRTYDLEAKGYHVSWQEIPHEISPMNRIISAYHGDQRIKRDTVKQDD